ncbi:MAG: hypothetical protein Q8L51_02940 [Candidatus Amesbacteria bacterium]|nr:hypothetical protein [Candidatus Amesbacteria bacterium]
MIFLLLLLLPSQLGFHFWPDWALVNGIRVDYLSPTLYLTDLIILIIWAFNRVKVKVPLISIILITLNIFFALSPLTSIFKWLRVLEYFWLFKYLILKIDLKLKIKKLKFAILWTSILAWMQFIKQSSIGGAWYWLGERSFNVFTPNIAKVFWEELILRPYATFPHPNVLGGFLAIAGILSGGWISAIAFTTLIITFSRTAIFAALAAVIFLKRHYSLLPLLLLPLLIPGSPDSLIGRNDLIRTSLDIISSNPLFGTGLGNFVRLSSQPVHNVFLLAISELGIPLGLIFAVWIIKFCLKIVNWKLKIALAAVMITASGDHYWWSIPQMQLLFTFFLAYAVKYSHGQLSDIYRRRIQR